VKVRLDFRHPESSRDENPAEHKERHSFAFQSCQSTSPRQHEVHHCLVYSRPLSYARGEYVIALGKRATLKAGRPVDAGEHAIAQEERDSCDVTEAAVVKPFGAHSALPPSVSSLWMRDAWHQGLTTLGLPVKQRHLVLALAKFHVSARDRIPWSTECPQPACTPRGTDH
jgi:hypothetical protein